MTYCLVTFNAVGTYHSHFGDFATVEEAEETRLRWGHTGLFNAWVVARENVGRLIQINDRDDREARWEEIK